MPLTITSPDTYITSDLHLDHERAIQFNNRPFKNLSEMQASIIGELNALPPKSTVYILGDTVVRQSKTDLRKLLDRIDPTLKLIFVLGNHDDSNAKVFKEYGEVHFLLQMRLDRRTLVMCHYPLTEWRRGQYGAIHFFGHCHGNYEHHGKSLDVGWDVHKRILRLSEAIEMADAKPIYQPCHNKNNGLLKVVDVQGF